ncbi:hypothetical protein AB395_00002529 [Sinorhizobium fredii CCBAU 45436]|nr:hypothetical protein AB395_00002529 [Sinorhizobium fredii CCBAU 45436]
MHSARTPKPRSPAGSNGPERPGSFFKGNDALPFKDWPAELCSNSRRCRNLCFE